ncbi:MAG: class I SAM-dependent methyltransferase [Candidatus Dormiibacterota bacterium]
MEPRFGRLYARAVLRPLAEQVVALLGVQAGEAACDLICDTGVGGVALGSAVGTRGHVMLVDTETALLGDAERDVSDTGCGASTLLAAGGGIPLGHASCDRVASLCTYGFWDGESLLDAARRATRPGGRAGVLTWDASEPPMHEVALLDALRAVTGIDSLFLASALAGPYPVQATHWEAVTLNDVVRFDGIADYWAAMVVERPIAAELTDTSEPALREGRAMCQRALERCTAADGTMRIPVRATLWCTTGSTAG